jgi:hypothetical protein
MEKNFRQDISRKCWVKKVISIGEFPVCKFTLAYLRMNQTEVTTVKSNRTPSLLNNRKLGGVSPVI